jgi:hypothetical protein
MPGDPFAQDDDLTIAAAAAARPFVAAKVCNP